MLLCDVPKGIPRQIARTGEEGSSVIIVDVRGDWHQARGGCRD
jgi:hypothetical protein